VGIAKTTKYHGSEDWTKYFQTKKAMHLMNMMRHLDTLYDLITGIKTSLPILLKKMISKMKMSKSNGEKRWRLPGLATGHT
jgi:hypothetical protein